MKSSINVIKWTPFGKKIGYLLVGLLIMSHCSLNAQETDFATWADVGFIYKVKPQFDLSGGLEWRTKNNLGTTDRWGLEIGGSYKPLSFLKLGAGYEVHYRNRGEDGWKFRHGYRVDGTLSAAVCRLKFSLRERFQHTFDTKNNELHLRSRAKLAYDIPKCKLEPYVSVEMYNTLNHGNHFDVQRMRYRGGITLPFFDCWEADVFYCRQWERNKQKNIVGVECSYHF